MGGVGVGREMERGSEVLLGGEGEVEAGVGKEIGGII
jgi:hypothetical protein